MTTTSNHPRYPASEADADGEQSTQESVTLESFVRAESDTYMVQIATRGAFSKFLHRREPTRAGQASVIRPNGDMLMSLAVLDLDAGPATVTLPDSGKRLMSMQVINQDHYTGAVVYASGRHTLTREDVGTRYAVVGVRMLVNALDPGDLAEGQALQDMLGLEQGGEGAFPMMNWNQDALKELRDALLVLAKTIPDTKCMFGSQNEVDPLRHLIGTALGWGGQSERDAYYLNVTPRLNDGETVHRLKVANVPVDGFWSISVYNESGYFHPSHLGLHTINSLTARQNDDGSVEVQFGGDDGDAPNHLPITSGWNYMVRLYRARPELLSGRWTFPQAQPV